APFPRTIRALSWARPDSWVRVGRRLRGADAVIIVHALPAVVPAHLALLRAAGALPGPPGSDASSTRPQSIVVCHNVIPLEARAGDARLMAALLARTDSALVHTIEQAAVAHDLGARRVSVADLPPHVRGGGPVSRGSRPGPVRLLALGLIREHKGIDVLLRAMRSVPEVTLTIAGELWGANRQVIGELVSDPRLAGRVEIRDGYVPADELAALLADHDVLALPYRSATSTSNVVLAHTHGLPVLATAIAPFTQQVVDGVNGLLVPPGDEQALTGALRRLLEPDVRHRLAEGVRTPDLSGPWAHYLGTLEALSVDAFVLDDAPAPAATSHDPIALHAAWAAQRRRIANRVSSRRAIVALDRDDLPDWVLATDVLGEPSEADDAKRLARALGLPRSFDRVAAWAALGALAVIVRVRDDGRRSAVIVDETGTRSLFSRWARAVGFAPVEIDFTGSHPSVAALDVDTGSLDVIVRIHPRGCDATDVDHVLEQAAWALRSHGLLVITVPIGPQGAEGAISPADVRGILARADDLGFVLIGDLDGTVNARMRDAAERARADDAAYGLVRLTLRRR
ncbi:MAG: glycosyltransferase family 4 protein, partial [Terracoccus sp.]